MCVRVRVCALWKRGRSLCISIYVRRTILFPFIGGCGVCGEMSVAHFHTPIVSHWACTCGGCRPWLHFHHIIHGVCWDLERDCCECVRVLGGIAWRFLFFIFHVSIQQGNVLPYLGHHGVRETAWYCLQENTSFSWQRRTGHCLSLELLLLTDELKIPQRRWDACRKADAETRAHPALIRKHTHNISFYLLFLWQSLWALPVFPRGGNGTDVDLHVHRCVHFCVFKHGNVRNWEGKRNGYIFPFLFLHRSAVCRHTVFSDWCVYVSARLCVTVREEELASEER